MNNLEIIEAIDRIQWDVDKLKAIAEEIETDYFSVSDDEYKEYVTFYYKHAQVLFGVVVDYILSVKGKIGDLSQFVSKKLESDEGGKRVD